MASLALLLACALLAVPDQVVVGRSAGSRPNGHGVDLNRNLSAGWRPIGRPDDLQHSGPLDPRAAARHARAVLALANGGGPG